MRIVASPMTAIKEQLARNTDLSIANRFQLLEFPIVWAEVRNHFRRDCRAKNRFLLCNGCVVRKPLVLVRKRDVNIHIGMIIGTTVYTFARVTRRPWAIVLLNHEAGEADDCSLLQLF